MTLPGHRMLDCPLTSVVAWCKCKMKYWISLCLFLCALRTCSAVFQPYWRSYIAWLLQQHQRMPFSPVVIPAPLTLPPDLIEALSPQTLPGNQYFLPDVILWDPVQQYAGLTSLQICYEQGCGLPLKVLRWQDGSKQRYTPRCLYGISGPVLLLCQIFHVLNTTSSQHVIHVF